MKSNAQIKAIFIALTAGLPMQSMGKVKVKIDSGIEGDRYALGAGTYSALKPTKVRHISLISLSGIEVANEWLQAGEEPVFDASETRRNIVLKEITASELNNLTAILARQYKATGYRTLHAMRETCTTSEQTKFYGCI